MFLGDVTAVEIDSVDENRAQVHKGIVNIIDLTIGQTLDQAGKLIFLVQNLLQRQLSDLVT